MRTTITAMGNAGVHVAAGPHSVYVDAFHKLAHAGPADAPATLILVTHAHWDHFDPGMVVEAARRTGAAVVGPKSVADRLSGRLPAGSVVGMEPPAAGDGRAACSVRGEVAGAVVTAFRTFHSRDHNSYLVELPGFRFLHDGDNEDTRRLDAEGLGRLDALLIGPWLGGGWVEFVEALRPGRWFLIHLDDEELRQHDAGRFLPDLCDRVPPDLVVLKPGETFVFE
jgi:L-ascorbate metabolism protein UlaG (beta-lactamase superfamily)